MTTTTLTRPTVSSVPRTVALLASAVVVASAANAIVAFAAVAAGASPTFAPLTAPAFITFTTVGVLVGYLGWRIVRRIAPNPARVLRVLVPVVLVLSWVPDVVLGILQFIPGSSLTGAVGLGIMHAVVVAVAVPVYLRVAPVR